MIVWLDHKIFGNGYGLGSPFFDGKFYWLVDTWQRERGDERGELYTFSPGFGAQLHSFQWFHPKPGETRVLGGKRYTPFNSHRRWLRVGGSWSVEQMPKGIDEANAYLRDIEKELGRIS